MRGVPQLNSLLVGRTSYDEAGGSDHRPIMHEVLRRGASSRPSLQRTHFERWPISCLRMGIESISANRSAIEIGSS